MRSLLQRMRHGVPAAAMATQNNSETQSHKDSKNKETMNKNKQNLNTSMRSLLQRMRHGVPAAAMTAQNNLETQSHTDSKTSSKPRNEGDRPNFPPVQHDSSTWLERPNIPGFARVSPVKYVFMNDQPTVSPDAGGRFIPVASMRRYTHLHLSVHDKGHTRGHNLTTCSTRFDALSNKEEGPEEDDESISGARESTTDQSVKTGKKFAAGQPGTEKHLTSAEEKSYLEEYLHASDAKKKHSGWHQAVLPAGHTIKLPRAYKKHSKAKHAVASYKHKKLATKKWYNGKTKS